jgi:hypothetical protein
MKNWRKILPVRFGSLVPARVGALGFILLWALGVPIPILLLIYLLQGC